MSRITQTHGSHGRRIGPHGANTVTANDSRAKRRVSTRKEEILCCRQEEHEKKKVSIMKAEVT